jgi:alpha-galactosidase
MNRDLTTAGLADGRPGYRPGACAYALLARLRAAHPQVEIESCSGGGGRIDFGVLRHTHRVWTSDCIDALSRVAIQRGFLQFFPPEIMGAHMWHSAGAHHRPQPEPELPCRCRLERALGARGRRAPHER